MGRSGNGVIPEPVPVTMRPRRAQTESSSVEKAVRWPQPALGALSSPALGRSAIVPDQLQSSGRWDQASGPRCDPALMIWDLWNSVALLGPSTSVGIPYRRNQTPGGRDESQERFATRRKDATVSCGGFAAGLLLLQGHATSVACFCI